MNLSNQKTDHHLQYDRSSFSPGNVSSLPDLRIKRSLNALKISDHMSTKSGVFVNPLNLYHLLQMPQSPGAERHQPNKDHHRARPEDL